MFKQSDKREILKGIYEENLWVAGKGEARKVDKPSARSLEKRKLHPLSLISAASVVLLGGIFMYWLGSFNKAPGGVTSGVAPSQISGGAPLTGTAQVSTGKVPGLAPLDSQKSVVSETDPKSFPKTLQKKLPDVDNLEDLAIPGLDDIDVDPGNYEALAESGMPIAELFGLGVNTIVIDPGHGGKDPGAVGNLGVFEKDVALEIAKRLRSRLRKHEHFEVLMTREGDDTISLNDRVEYANANQADLFISIHVNYFPSEHSFIETYYFGPTDDTTVASLAKLENADSHYEYGEFKDIIQKIGDTLKFQESRQLAHSVQSNLYGRMKKINKQARDHGIKSAPFVVLLGLDAPSILSEVSCFCNPAEEQRLKTAEYRENIAAFLEKGIVSYLNKNTSVGGKRNGEKEELAKAQQQQ
ncbi:MAG: N-acetylmuramoyl-L-alanine amidase [Gammaproteobacteria bacterium]|nr:N-acetylmuramoyl-L-alanine amidase [Gammaproteobacteria bacterium]